MRWKSFAKTPCPREELREYLNPVYDLERLLGKVSYRTANPRDLLAFANSMEMLPHIKTVLRGFSSRRLVEIETDLDDLGDLYDLIRRAITEEPPRLRPGGGHDPGGIR